MGEKPSPLGEDFSMPVRAKADYHPKAGGIRAAEVEFIRRGDWPIKLSP